MRPVPVEPEPFDAVLLAGGRARRLGGADKPGLPVGGRPMLHIVAGAAAGAGLLVVVGPDRGGLPEARHVREDPPGGGPVPALRAGLPLVTAPRVALLAADLPFLSEDDLRVLRAAAEAPGGAGAVLLDDTGREQWLAGVWRTEPLRAALAGYRGTSLYGLLGPLRPAGVAPPGERRGREPWFDCDTADDLRRARERA